MTEVLGRFEKELLIGAQPSLPGKRPLFVKSAVNVISDEQSLQPVFGFRRFAPRPAMEPILGMQTILVSSVPTLYAATKSSIFKYTRASGWSEEGTGYTGTNLDLWSMAPWGNWLAATNNVNAPQLDKGSGFAALAGTPPAKVVAVVPWKSFLLLITQDGVFWSDADDIEDYVPVPENLSGDLPARDILSTIRAALPLGELIVYYTGDQQRAVQFIGAPDVFGRVNLSSGIGAVGRNAVCFANRRHYGWGPKGLWESDGAQFRYIDGDVKDFIQNDLEASLVGRVCTFHLPQYRGIVFSYPKKGELGNFSSLMYQYETNSFWPQAWGRTCSLEDTTFGSHLFGDENGDIWELPVAQSSSSVAIQGAPLAMAETWQGRVNKTLVPYGELTFGSTDGESMVF